MTKRADDKTVLGLAGLMVLGLFTLSSCGDDSTGGGTSACEQGCDDGIQCTIDRCDEDRGTCTHEPDDTRCEAGQHCVADQGCRDENQECHGDGDCDDNDACTVDTCSENHTCEHSPVTNPPAEGPGGDATCSNGIDDDCDGQTDSDDPDCRVDEQGCSLDGIPDRPLDFQADDTFDLGPYLMHVTTESIVVMWRTESAEQCSLHYGPGDDLSLVIDETAAVRVHEVELTGLDADTRYAYRVQCGDREGDRHHFVTAPRPGQPFRFAVWGDSRSNPDAASSVIARIAEFDPYINVNVGDVVATGIIASQWKTQWFDPLRPLGHEISTYVAIGNHEADADSFYELHSYPHPSDDPGHESYYSFTYGNAFFLIIDTNKDFTPDGDTDTPISQWIREQVASDAAQNARWRFAFAHHPGYSEGWSPCTYDGERTVRDFLLPLLAEHGFHMYFAGHTHDYERGFKDGMVQIITGGGGSGLDDYCTDFEHVTVFAAVHHYVALDVDCSRVEVRTVDVDGNVIDHFALEEDQPGEIIELGN